MIRFFIVLWFSFYFFTICSTVVLSDGFGRVVVPSSVINIGEVLHESKLKELVLSNSNLRGDYARSTKDVVGFVTRRTLLPDRVIPMSALQPLYVITRGSKVRIVFSQKNMTISTSGIALSDASIGSTLSVKNIDTGVIVSGQVMNDSTVSVTLK
ncbi:flagellar basal body P-ring formation chaperone FlgA [Candidatus Liberibacter americanus]|uniref:Flagella basal body P-ring formation protein FlgA n=1 Tax=Candidatus Liberibacter americanus str. Sao Paulo TaxID=1261131 RepID=U6B7A9_9HYPH|nr:flagellar basal body P-ring formation chaperone FlgA [Candidatus Liberibacter americanus]AHA27642.1 Flagellar basal body P-ring biosynthesis protein [Candidatus Liberibacter americanus str. Sao Paulo]EMS36351.1 flagellar basal body P-ring biosynthesis protein FlgA [Candidatus Liberibacter americanus PW_SP]